MKVILTKSFSKLLSKIESVKREDIVVLLKKYPNTTNIKEIDVLENSKILKGYLLSKKVRILVLFQDIKGKFLLVSIVRKETKKGENITKENYIELFGNDIDRSIIDVGNNEYEELDI